MKQARRLVDDPSGIGQASSEAVLRLLSAEREHIAGELSDAVVQELFNAGMDLHSALARVSDDITALKIRAAITELDQAIQNLRNTVFDIRTSREPAGTVPDQV